MGARPFEVPRHRHSAVLDAGGSLKRTRPAGVWREAIASGRNRLRGGEVAPAAPDLRPALGQGAIGVVQRIPASLVICMCAPVEFNYEDDAIGATHPDAARGVREDSKNFAAL